DRILMRTPFYREVVERHVEAMTRADVRTVLELGAGTGNVTVRLLRAGRAVTAIDLSRAMLARLLDKVDGHDGSALQVFEQDARAIPQVADGSCDGVSVLLALYDMANPRQALQEAIRTLRPGGSLVITEPRRTFQLQPLLDYGL